MLHDSDQGENRFQEDEWKYYELWEKVEVRLRRKKILIAFLVISVFLFLSAIPVWIDQSPRLKAKKYLNRLAIELNQLKLEAIDKKMALRVRFVDDRFVVEQLPSCRSALDTQATAPIFLREGRLLPENESRLVRLTSDEAKNFGLRGILDEFCYDPLYGFEGGLSNSAFALIPKEDIQLREERRVVLLLLKDLVADPILD
jgi:hypothetical protein